MRPICEVYQRMKEMYPNESLWWLYVTLHNDFSDDKRYGNYVYKNISPALTIKRVIFNPPATIIMWSDNTKSVVKCQDGEAFDPEKGFVLAYLKKLLGNDNTFNKEIHKWVKYEAPVEEKVVEEKKDEIKWRVVDRPAKVGDYIRLIDCDYSFDKLGDILKVDRLIGDSGAVQVYGKNHKRDTGGSTTLWCYTKREYEVVEKVTTTTEITEEDDTNEPLTTEQLMKMDGQKVWCNSVIEGEDEQGCYVHGWHTVDVANERLFNDFAGGYWFIRENGVDCGFHAYCKEKGV